MFWWIFAIVWIICLLLLIFGEGLARSRASGPGEPVNWWATIGWSGAAALMFALVIQGLISLF